MEMGNALVVTSAGVTTGHSPFLSAPVTQVPTAFGCPQGYWVAVTLPAAEQGMGHVHVSLLRGPSIWEAHRRTPRRTSMEASHPHRGEGLYV